ncbi:MAG: hypothetical protein A07HR60_01067 [uncultured archaeon A07HR60]|jgi:hypothetical protein|nr:MAG: hypothetical protein A07HR60_01067 [uncultured archaeon A07HR60]
MLLAITYSREARTTLRNICQAHGEAICRRFGRAVLFAETLYGAFLTLRLREKHGDDVQLERTVPFNEFTTVPERVRKAAAAYVQEAEPHTPYARFAVGTGYPHPESLRDCEL